MRLLLIRHGETDHNAGQVALGRADVPLNERGRSQAQALAAALPAHGPIAAIYASPLLRAVDTASPVAAALGLGVEIEDTLIEMDVGEADGLPYPELRERFPEFLRAWRSDAVGETRMPGGETLREVQERAWAAVGSLKARHTEETVIAVSHNFVILTLLCRALDLPLSRFRRLRHDLAAVSAIELTPERAVVVTLNDRSHLRAGPL